jgi:hypothetical protein
MKFLRKRAPKLGSHSSFTACAASEDLKEKRNEDGGAPHLMLRIRACEAPFKRSLSKKTARIGA